MPRYERVSAAGAIAAAVIVGACAGAPAPQGSPSSSPSFTATPITTTNAPPAASSASAYLALGPLEPGEHTAHFATPFTFESEAGWSVLSDATDHVELADTNDQTSLITFAKPSGMPAGITADALVKMVRPGSATAPSAATIGGVSGVRFEFLAVDGATLFYLGEPAGAQFGLGAGEKARFFVALLNKSPLVIIIHASATGTFATFAPRAEKLLATVKFQQ
jgi:hypothetical protein